MKAICYSILKFYIIRCALKVWSGCKKKKLCLEVFLRATKTNKQTSLVCLGWELHEENVQLLNCISSLPGDSLRIESNISEKFF